MRKRHCIIINKDGSLMPLKERRFGSNHTNKSSLRQVFFDLLAQPPAPVVVACAFGALL